MYLFVRLQSICTDLIKAIRYKTKQKRPHKYRWRHKGGEPCTAMGTAADCYSLQTTATLEGRRS